MLITGAVLMFCFGLQYYRTKNTTAKKALVWKALATFMAVAAAFGAVLKDAGTISHLILAGTIFCMAADVLLEIRFLAGVACFGMGHICFIAGFYKDGDYRNYTPVIFIILLAIMLALFSGFFGVLKGLLVPGIIYAVLLCAMAAIAVTAAISQRDVSGIVRGAGGMCFFISDAVLGWSTLKGIKDKGYGALVLILYFPAVYLLVLSGY